MDCDGLLISFSFKLLVLALGSWAVFYRAPRATLPRIHLFRALLTLLLFIFLLAFWLFYGVRLVEQRRKIQYSDIVQVPLQNITTLHIFSIACLKLNLPIMLMILTYAPCSTPPLCWTRCSSSTTSPCCCWSSDTAASHNTSSGQSFGDVTYYQ